MTGKFSIREIFMAFVLYGCVLALVIHSAHLSYVEERVRVMFKQLDGDNRRASLRITKLEEDWRTRGREFRIRWGDGYVLGSLGHWQLCVYLERWDVAIWRVTERTLAGGTLAVRRRTCVWSLRK